MNNLTPLAVKYATLLLIERNSNTTTLEVKNLLRQINYQADQDEVSHFMAQAADELPLEFTVEPHSGNYRIYTLASPSASVTTDHNYPDLDDGEIGLEIGDGWDGLTGAQISKMENMSVADYPKLYTNSRGYNIYVFTDYKKLLDFGLDEDVTRISQSTGHMAFFIQDISRGQARQAHADVFHVNYNNVRSSLATG
jgi:hypothetical protein